MQNLGLSVPNEFKIAAQYILSQEFNEIIRPYSEYIDEDTIQSAIDIMLEANLIGVEVDKSFFKSKIDLTELKTALSSSASQ